VVAAADHWVSAAAIRQAIGAWAYSLGAGEQRPSNEAVRAAIGVACAIRELALDAARRPWLGGDAAPQDLTRPLPLDLAVLSEWSGTHLREVEASLTLLASAGAITVQRGGSVATVALSGAVVAPLPAVARVGWSEVRARLAHVGASVAPALAVLRELATELGAVDNRGAIPSLRVSVRALEDATGFGRSTVSEALIALEYARVLDIETRAGRTTRFTLRPAAFGQVDEPPRAAEEAPATGQGSERQGWTVSAPIASAAPAPHEETGGTANPRRVASAPAAVTSVAPEAGGAAVLVGAFAGTPIYAPPGTPLVVECDAEGRWSCRVGPFLTLGPTMAADGE
jgi:hypothetical protein